MLETGYSPRRSALVALPLALALALHGATARATEHNAAEPLPGASEGPPPPINTHYAQYGVALVAQTVPEAGDACPSASNAPCILGPGAGLAVRVGYRGRGDWYFGGAYEFSRLAASNLLRLPILQQLRAEARYEMTRTTRVIPYLAFGLGATSYGNEWGIDTAGAVAMAGFGTSLQLSRSSLVGAALSYRPLILRGWTDGTGERRADSFGGFGAAHLVTLELTFELRSALSRW